jgi:hypothetical protein
MRAGLDRLRKARLHDRLHNALGDRRTIRIQRWVAPLFRHNLTALALVYWSDKAGHHHYTEHYPTHLGHLRRRPMRLLEIGIGGFESATWGGASLRMWRDYFRQGQIHGLDIHEKQIIEPRIHVHRGDQSDAQFMRDLGREQGPFDVIIDDGSHISSHIRTSFQALFDDHLNAGGYYVIEDLDYAYSSTSDEAEPGSPDTSVALVKSLVDVVNLDPSRVSALHLYQHIAFIEKGGR